MEFIYGIKHEDNIDPTAVFLFGAVKYNTIIETAWEAVPLYHKSQRKKTAPKNHCKC